MEQFLGFALPGVPYGCTYALVAVCLVLTYQATGVFNFAFGAQAFASAFIFTYLTQYHGWTGWEAFLLTVVVMGPVIGYAFDRLIFRHIPNSNSTAKLVCSLALLVGIPSLLPVIFGPQNLDATTTIFPFFNPNVVYFTIGSGPTGPRSTGSTWPPSRSPWSSSFCSPSFCASRALVCRCGAPWRVGAWSSSTASTPTASSPWRGSSRASWRPLPACCSLRCTGPSIPTNSSP